VGREGGILFIEKSQSIQERNLGGILVIMNKKES